MNKAIRIAIAAAFGVAATLPAFADFEKNGPNDQQGKGMTSLQEVNPPALDGNSTVTSNRASDGRIYSSDAGQYSADRPVRSERHFFRSDRRDDRVMADGYGHQSPSNQVYGGVSEPGSFSEPGMKAGEFNWDHYTTGSTRGYGVGE
jgi:hypothetical protein